MPKASILAASEKGRTRGTCCVSMPASIAVEITERTGVAAGEWLEQVLQARRGRTPPSSEISEAGAREKKTCGQRRRSSNAGVMAGPNFPLHAHAHESAARTCDRPHHALRPGGRTTTIAPCFTRFTRSMTSSLVMRMQPDEMAWPIYSGWLVPWMRYRVSLLPWYR
jgi:hypothetical protein